MPTCNGAGCLKKIPWKITMNNGLELDSKVEGGYPAEVEKFTLKGIADSLIQILTYRSQFSVFSKYEVPVHNLCDTCWKDQDREWSGNENIYGNDRARTTSGGIYFNVFNSAFEQEDVLKVSTKEIILSCMCHELMHYWSFESKGLQGFCVGFNWDELVADMFGYFTYSRVFINLKQYVTPYNDHPDFLDCIDRRIKTQYNQGTSEWKLSGLRKRLSDKENKFIQGDRAKKINEEKISAIIRLKIYESLKQWFFHGPTQPVCFFEKSIRFGEFTRDGILSDTGVFSFRLNGNNNRICTTAPEATRWMTLRDDVPIDLNA